MEQTPMRENTKRVLKYFDKINNTYHDYDETIDLLSELTKTNIDHSNCVFPPIYFDYALNFHIGKNCFINMCCNFQDQGGIYIGDNVYIGHGVKILTINHDVNPLSRHIMHMKPVYFEDNVCLSSGVIILPGVRIGKNSIIGAGAVVTKDIEENSIAVGNPSKVIKKLEVNL